MEERLAVVETRTEALPLMQTQISEIAAWVNQQKGREALGKYIIPLAALAIAIASFVKAA